MKSYLLGVVGQNIAYSRSPFIHEQFATQFDMTLKYSIEEVGSLSFSQKIKTLQEQGFNGCNITVPFKEEAFGLAHERSERAKLAGAANTFLFKGNKISADNTDGVGFIKDLTDNLNFEIKGKRILICGAGGAVRGIFASLVDAQPSLITVANRTRAKAEAIVQSMGESSVTLFATSYEKLAGRYDLIIDGTSLRGSTPLFLDKVALNEGALMYDLKYNLTQPTFLTEWARQQGARVQDGLGMLVEQAAIAFQLWTGEFPETSQVLATLRSPVTLSSDG